MELEKFSNAEIFQAAMARSKFFADVVSVAGLDESNANDMNKTFQTLAKAFARQDAVKNLIIGEFSARINKGLKSIDGVSLEGTDVLENIAAVSEYVKEKAAELHNKNGDLLTKAQVEQRVLAAIDKERENAAKEYSLKIDELQKTVEGYTAKETAAAQLSLLEKVAEPHKNNIRGLKYIAEALRRDGVTLHADESGAIKVLKKDESGELVPYRDEKNTVVKPENFLIAKAKDLDYYMDGALPVTIDAPPRAPIGGANALNNKSSEQPMTVQERAKAAINGNM